MLLKSSIPAWQCPEALVGRPARVASAVGTKYGDAAYTEFLQHSGFAVPGVFLCSRSCVVVALGACSILRRRSGQIAHSPNSRCSQTRTRARVDSAERSQEDFRRTLGFSGLPRAAWNRCSKGQTWTVQRAVADADKAAAEKFDMLASAQQLAERAGDEAGATRLKDQLQEAEASNPVAAIGWRRQRKLRIALDTVLLGVGDPLESRLKAVKTLQQLATPPLPAQGAEDALHRILREVSGQDAGKLREAAEEALWQCWHTSGDEEVAAAMRTGASLMEQQKIQEALEVFSELIDKVPDFAEAWNRRATCFYVLEDYDRSIEDCAKVLALKPRHFGCLSGLGMCQSANGNKAEAAKWFKACLKVHPCMKGPRHALDRIEREGIVETHLTPRVTKAVEALENGILEPAEHADGLALSWDVHQILPRGAVEDTSPTVYFFRVCIRNKSFGMKPVRSLARFYVMRFRGGHVLPLCRPTEGSAEFMLEPGEEYRYSWAFTVSRELEDMVGGMLLERLDSVGEDEEQRFLQASMDNLVFSQAPVVPMSRVELLTQGHFYMGQLDLRQASDS